MIILSFVDSLKKNSYSIKRIQTLQMGVFVVPKTGLNNVLPTVSVWIINLYGLADDKYTAAPHLYCIAFPFPSLTARRQQQPLHDIPMVLCMVLP